MASQLSAVMRRNINPGYSDSVLNNASSAYQAALYRDELNRYKNELATQQDQFNQSMSLQREIADQNSKDSKTASLIGGVGTLVSSPKLMEKLLGVSNGASSAITAEGTGTGDYTASSGVDFSDDAALGGGADVSTTGSSSIAGSTGSSDYGLNWSGLGQAGLGALVGSSLGSSDLEKAAIGASVPLAINIGTELWNAGWENSDLLGAAADSLFPSVAGGLGALLF